VGRRRFIRAAVPLLAVAAAVAIYLLQTGGADAPPVGSIGPGVGPAPGAAHKRSRADVPESPRVEAVLPQARPRSEREILAAATVISVPPLRDQGEGPPTEPPIGPAAARSPELEQEVGEAIAQWKKEASAVASQCAHGSDRREVELQVLLGSSASGDPGDQEFRAQWITAAPETLRALADKHDPFELTACLQQVRGLSFRVSLPPSERGHALPPSMQVLTAAL
jgi:hypothetical protein